MARYGVETRRSPEEVIQLALTFFGEEGLGLSLTSEDGCCISFEGGGGHVTVAAAREGTPGEHRTNVELESREWDYHVRRFMGEI